MLLVIIYAFAAYLLAEGLRLSGIVAILFVGITMAHYTYGNLSKYVSAMTVGTDFLISPVQGISDCDEKDVQGSGYALRDNCVHLSWSCHF